MEVSGLGIRELSGYAWHCAVRNVASVLEEDVFEVAGDWAYIEGVAEKLGVRFDVNGNIVKNWEVDNG